MYQIQLLSLLADLKCKGRITNDFNGSVELGHPPL